MSKAKNKIVIIDYGMGNLASVAMAFNYLGVTCDISSSKKDIEDASALVLPGVGAFKAAMENINRLNLKEILDREVVEKGKPYLGICLGMQLLASDSTEKGYAEGFGWIDGHVTRIETKPEFRVPHVGWNNIDDENDHFIFTNISGEKNFYFDHSFHMACPEKNIIASVDYGSKLVAAVAKDNILATQFHPEKSQRNGLKLLRNFLNFAAKS